MNYIIHTILFGTHIKLALATVKQHVIVCQSLVGCRIFYEIANYLAAVGNCNAVQNKLRKQLRTKRMLVECFQPCNIVASEAAAAMIPIIYKTVAIFKHPIS